MTSIGSPILTEKSEGDVGKSLPLFVLMSVPREQCCLDVKFDRRVECFRSAFGTLTLNYTTTMHATDISFRSDVYAISWLLVIYMVYHKSGCSAFGVRNGCSHQKSEVCYKSGLLSVYSLFSDC